MMKLTLSSVSAVAPSTCNIKFAGDARAMQSLAWVGISKDSGVHDLYIPRKAAGIRETVEGYLTDWLVATRGRLSTLQPKPPDTHNPLYPENNFLLMGPDGSGKTTTMRYVHAKFDQYTRGTKPLPKHTITAMAYDDLEQFITENRDPATPPEAQQPVLVIAEEIALAYLIAPLTPLFKRLKALNPNIIIMGESGLTTVADLAQQQDTASAEFDQLFPTEQRISLNPFTQEELWYELAQTFRAYGYTGLTEEKQKELTAKRQRDLFQDMRIILQDMGDAMQAYWVKKHNEAHPESPVTEKPQSAENRAIEEPIPDSVFEEVFLGDKQLVKA